MASRVSYYLGGWNGRPPYWLNARLRCSTSQFNGGVAGVGAGRVMKQVVATLASVNNHSIKIIYISGASK